MRWTRWCGATRVASSINFKDKYAPDFPRVAIRQANIGRMTTTDELDRLGLVAAPVTVCAAASHYPRPCTREPSNRTREFTHQLALKAARPATSAISSTPTAQC
jgi:hypothetical protein